MIYPYALRFAKNSALLKNLGIATVTVEQVYDVPEIQRQIVIYPKLPGTVLRETLLTAGDKELRTELLECFAGFVALLHDKGVLFRSIHFGNVLNLPSGNFALIDIADLRYPAVRRPFAVAETAELQTYVPLSSGCEILSRVWSASFC